jgi:hypothetical protein
MADTRMPEVNTDMQKTIDDLLADPVGHLQRVRAEAEVRARAFVDQEVERILAERSRCRLSFRARVGNVGERMRDVLRSHRESEEQPDAN